jgi:hypothetical protein
MTRCPLVAMTRWQLAWMVLIPLGFEPLYPAMHKACMHSSGIAFIQFTTVSWVSDTHLPTQKSFLNSLNDYLGVVPFPISIWGISLCHSTARCVAHASPGGNVALWCFYGTNSNHNKYNYIPMNTLQYDFHHPPWPLYIVTYISCSYC